MTESIIPRTVVFINHRIRSEKYKRELLNSEYRTVQFYPWDVSSLNLTTTHNLTILKRLLQWGRDVPRIPNSTGNIEMLYCRDHLLYISKTHHLKNNNYAVIIGY